MHSCQYYVVSFPFIYKLLCSAWNNQSIPEWIWQCLSTNKTSRHTSLTLPPEIGLQGEESAVWLLCGNPDYLLMQSSLSTVCNPCITTFNLSPPPVQLTSTCRQGKKRGKLKKSTVTQVTLHVLWSLDPENLMNALHSHGWAQLTQIWACTHSVILTNSTWRIEDTTSDG